MKTLKLVLWIFVLYIIQNIFYPIISVTGIVPDLFLGFVVAYSAFEHRFNKLSSVIIICALVAGCGTGRVFPVVTLFVGLSGIAAYQLCSYLRFIPQFLRMLVLTAVFAFVMSITEFFALSRTITSEFITGTALWQTLYTVLVAGIIYFAVKKTILKNKEKKLLIAQERS